MNHRLGKGATRWTHASVLALSTGDPVSEVTARARAMALEGLDRGWRGPPFDPVALAQLLGIDVEANASIRDARTVPVGRGRVRIEFNPNRPRGRMRYSVAHELAHTLFPDVAERVRHRSLHHEMGGDEWQLEALCNIAAAELLMPVATFAADRPAPLTMHYVMEQQRLFDVSTEALVIRLVEISDEPLAAFCASPIQSESAGRQYQLDYIIGSRAWPNRIPPKLRLPRHTVIAQCTAIGYSASGLEKWSDRLEPAQIEAVGIPPYPGGEVPRVVGFLSIPQEDEATINLPRLALRLGDALDPRADGHQFVVHVVNDKTANWGGGGFASALRNQWPAVQDDFRQWAEQRTNLRLGNVRLCRVTDQITVASVVAQHGYGFSDKPRIRYSALRQGLRSVEKAAAVRNASVHMPRIGTGQAGGNWEVVSDIILETLVDQGIFVNVYDLPGTKLRAEAQTKLDLF